MKPDNNNNEEFIRWVTAVKGSFEAVENKINMHQRNLGYIWIAISLIALTLLLVVFCK